MISFSIKTQFKYQTLRSTIFSLKLQTLDGVEIEHAQRIKAIQNLPQIIPIIEHEEHKYAIER